MTDSKDQSLADHVIYRLAVEADAPFFYKTILNSYYHSSPYTKRILPGTFRTAHAKLLERVMLRPLAKLVIAADREDPTTIIGFALVERTVIPLVHYVYVKMPFRQMGAASGMLKAVQIDINKSEYTHFTIDAGKIVVKYNGISYNPYALYD